MATAKKKAKSGARAKAKEGPEDLFVAAVREHDFACKDARDAWTRTKFVTLMLAWLVGEPPTAKRSKALAQLFGHAREILAAADRAGADAALAVLTASSGADRAKKNRAAFELAELRDNAVRARKPALAAFVDALAHTAEALASHADGDEGTPVRRGIEVGRSLLFSIAERRVKNGEDREARAAASRDLADVLRAALPTGP